MSQLLLQQMQVGPMANYIYFVGDNKSREVAVIDPAWDVSFLKRKAQEANLKLVAALVTHMHPDHNNGLGALLSSDDIPVYVSEIEAPFYRPIKDNIKPVKSGDKLKLGEVELSFMHTPGHTPGSQCFWVNGNLISGDTLFIDGCGRCDLPGGDAETMYDTLYNRLMKLPDNTIIYPGHNYHAKSHDTLAGQKKTNPYLQCQNLKEFLEERMGY